MEVKYPVTASIRTTVRTVFELLAILFAIVLPLVAIAFTMMNTDLSTWKLITCGITGTLIWWYFCWFSFWLIV